jgi:hypothetical protein
MGQYHWVELIQNFLMNQNSSPTQRKFQADFETQMHLAAMQTNVREVDRV